MNRLTKCFATSQSWLALFGLALALLACSPELAFAQDEEGDTTQLDGVIGDMQVAGGRLGKLLTDKPTQQKQQDAIDKLDTLIKVLEQRRQQQGQGNQAGPSEKPAEDSTIRNGPGGQGAMHDANRKGKNWGQLPAHKREQIIQSMTEGFPPHYQQLLERYYRRMAEERPTEDVGDAPAARPAAPATPPAAPAAQPETKASAP
jgi:hypothetical protein